MAIELDDASAQADGFDDANTDVLWSEMVKQFADEGDERQQDPDAEAGDTLPDADESTAGDNDDDPDGYDDEDEDGADKLAVLRAENVKLRGDQRSAQGRVAAMRKQMAAVNEAAGTEDFAAARASVLEDFPEISAPLYAELGQLKSQLAAMIAAQGSELAEAERSVAQSHAANRADLDRHAPGGMAYVAANESAFGTWIMDQPLADRQAAQRNGGQIEDPMEAADLIRRFQQFHQKDPLAPGDPLGAQRSRRQRQIASTAGPRREGRSSASGIPKDGDHVTMFNQMVAAGMDKR